mmetsp:Transcript_51879/g.123460  ORF Transcript_51879/g.123460 Transcript_51879/m.123460 type:complete len:127 (-) Transcript_51879:34-414(-)|eukprot:CAMPEP_0178445614 /NCGR_PEP_ID=MMETSP0689_2-20121128/40283_1 /TAXON_ID=160604 /ORGANISM="Amphidinium massartii, Strain CS-259" /LENGTH=126 /DNA_ID=CAMNT_0020070221 /DNA_START=139 /DNA_END=519 /DNA_ORIENTATION=+
MGTGASASLGEANSEQLGRESSSKNFAADGTSSRNTNASGMSRTGSGSQSLKKSQYPRRIRHLYKHQRSKEQGIVFAGAGGPPADWMEGSLSSNTFLRTGAEEGVASTSSRTVVVAADAARATCSS